MKKQDFKTYIIIAFVVIELLSMIFNYNFIKIMIGESEYNVNFSIVFFCIAFFLVDIVADQFSPIEARKFIFYKLFSQILFLVGGNMAIMIYGLGETQLAVIFNKSWWMIIAGILSTVISFYCMISLMGRMKTGAYSRNSVFKRYLYSTLPSEILFSLIFTFLCFYKYSSFDELVNVFIASSCVKILLSIVFATLMSFIVKMRYTGTQYNAKFKSEYRTN